MPKKHRVCLDRLIRGVTLPTTPWSHIKIATLAILFVIGPWQKPLVTQGNESPQPQEVDPEIITPLSPPDAFPIDTSPSELSPPEPSPPEPLPTDTSQLENLSTSELNTSFTVRNPPPELHWLTSGMSLPDHLTTSTTISLSGLTPPSLWWINQQFGGKILDGWIAYPGTDTLPPRVDLVVNRQLWGLSDYLERYSFVHHFGQAAQEFGYTIRVFNDVGDALAIYPCPPSPSCSIIVDSSGLGVLRDNDPFSNF